MIEMKNYNNLGKCKICKKKIYGEQEHIGLDGSFAHWYCLLQKQYLENMKELPTGVF